MQKVFSILRWILASRRLILSTFIFVSSFSIAIWYEFRKSSGKAVGTQIFLSQASASAAISEWSLGLKTTAFTNFKLWKIYIYILLVTAILMHLKLERAKYVNLIVSSFSPTPNFQQKLKKTILLDFSCINRLWKGCGLCSSSLQYLQLLNLIRH